MKGEFAYKIEGKKRVRCPKCNKLGIMRKYDQESGGGALVVHKAKVGEYSGIITFTESCFIPKKELKQNNDFSKI